MKVEFDPENDALYLRLDEAKVIDSEQVAPGVIVDFDSQDRVVGLEVLALSRRLPKSKGRKHPPSPTMPEASFTQEKPTKEYDA